MRVLIVKTSSMGDTIHTLPALTDAVSVLSDIQFDWVIEEAFAEIPGWHPAVDSTIPIALRRWRKAPMTAFRSGEWQTFKRALRKDKYDAVIDAQSLLKSAAITRFARGTSYGLDWQSAREPLASLFYNQRLQIDKEQHAVERIRQLFAQSLSYTLPSSSCDFQLRKSSFPNTTVKTKNYCVFIHGTTWPEKHWPEKYWCSLAEKVNKAGFHIVLPWGTEKDFQRAKRIADSADSTEVLPRLSLSEIGGILAGASAAVCVDTGLGHLAAALGIPAIFLYGPTRPALVGARGKRQINLTIDQCQKQDLLEAHPAIFTPMTADVVWRELSLLL